jgi:hypothetical protein
MNSKYVYWGATGLVVLLALVSGGMYFFAEGITQEFQRLGFPSYFHIQLGIAKIAGAIVLLSPLPRWITEWAYAGFVIDFTSAGIAHAAAGDPASALVAPGVALLLTLISYASYRQYYLGSTEEDGAEVG